MFFYSLDLEQLSYSYFVRYEAVDLCVNVLLSTLLDLGQLSARTSYLGYIA